MHSRTRRESQLNGAWWRCGGRGVPFLPLTSATAVANPARRDVRVWSRVESLSWACCRPWHFRVLWSDRATAELVLVFMNMLVNKRASRLANLALRL